VISPTRVIGSIAVALTVVVVTFAARQGGPIQPRKPLDEREVVERGVALVRVDPKWGARRGECDDLAVSDLTLTVDGRRAAVESVERVPRPERHWLLIDVSESAEDNRKEAMRSARQYLDQVMTPGVDSASIVTVDEDPILVAGPSTDPKALGAAVSEIAPGGWSALRDGLEQILRQIQGDRHEHLIIYWTDGQDVGSLATHEDLLATLARVPNATVVTVALVKPGARLPQPPLGGATFMEASRRSGGEVFVSSDPRWLERIRGWVERRFTIGFKPPDPSQPPPAPGRGLEIAVKGKRCQVAFLPDPFAGPDAVAGAAPPAPATWVRLHGNSRESDDPGCATEDPGDVWTWPLSSTPRVLSGCMLDLVRAPGPIVRILGINRGFDLQGAALASRKVRILAPDLAALPTSAAEAIATLGLDRSVLMEGGALLTQRARIATSLFAARHDYHAFARQRLKRAADDEIAEIARDIARAFPDMPGEKVKAVARASRAGRRALEAAETPTDADLVRVLAAWIRDVPAADLLREIEGRLIDRRIVEGADPALAARWAELYDHFRIPSSTRIEAPLVLIRDPERDVVGFVRVVFPRPERFRPFGWLPRNVDVSTDGRLPLAPFALTLVDSVAERPGVGEILAGHEYRCAAIDIRPTRPVDPDDPMRPYAIARVAVELIAKEARVNLEAVMSIAVDGSVVIGDPTLKTTGDAELSKALQAGQTPTELPTQSRPLL
jgi:hypothetical protein